MPFPIPAHLRRKACLVLEFRLPHGFTPFGTWVFLRSSFAMPVCSLEIPRNYLFTNHAAGHLLEYGDRSYTGLRTDLERCGERRILAATACQCGRVHPFD